MRRPKTRFSGETRESLDIVPAGRLHAGAGIAIHHAAVEIGAGAPELAAMNRRDGPPRPGFDCAGVVPEPPINIAKVTHGHPDRIESGVGLGTKAQVLLQ